MGCRCNSYSCLSRYVTKAARFLTVASGVTLGAGIGFITYGDCVGSLEQNRQKAMREHFFGFLLKDEDLREKMWPEVKALKEKMWFQNMARTWSNLKDKMLSGRKS